MLTFNRLSCMVASGRSVGSLVLVNYPDANRLAMVWGEVVIDVPDRFKVRVRFKRIHFVAGPAARASREIGHHKLFNLLWLFLRFE